ncbi:MAG: hypothetical protein K5855_06670 [Oscillospiraceae bacterium]|nr:hypothetical protein [Oscillospiraceae bacterium]
MKAIKEIREEYRALIDADPEGNRAGALAMKANMERSPLYYRGQFTSPTLHIPRLYSEETIGHFRQIVRTAYAILEKVIREYLSNAAYRKLFPFSRELEELILLPNGYDSHLPIARFDIFYHEDSGKFYFCEINTDGTSAMNEDRLHDEFMLDNPAHQEMRRRYRFRTMELFDSWVQTFLSLYGTYAHRVRRPNVAIVDFMENGTLREFQEFARRFQRADADCEICDIRALRFEDGRLISPAGHIIDAVYRRAVTSDIMAHFDEVPAFLRAARENACFIAGSFRTQIVHHKSIFHILHLPETQRFLSPEERQFIREHVPKTMPFAKGSIPAEEVIRDRERYILKPDDSYGSMGVYAGVEYSGDEWEKIVLDTYGRGYICQEYCPQFSEDNIDFAFGDGQWHSYITMAGLFVYNGEFAGVYSRAAEGNGIIASFRNERAQPTYVVSDRPGWEK